MLKNIIHGERVTKVDYSLDFDIDSNGGFTFPCDENGNVGELTQAAVKNLEWCRSHPEKFTEFGVIRSRRYSWREPDRGTCACGRTVYLENEYMGACECECGRWYNLFGQELLPPDQWQETEYDH